MPGGWPVVLHETWRGMDVTLRPLRTGDARAWTAVRTANVGWLTPWESTGPDGPRSPQTFGQLVRGLNREARAGRLLPFALDVDDRLVGQVTVGGVTWGSLLSAHIGYWVDQRVAGRGIVPTAVAMVIDHCLFTVGLHRLEVNIRPENRPSLRVVQKLGLRDEGLRRRYLHIDGAWRDHRSFAVTVEDVPNGVLPSWRRSRTS